MPVLNTNVIVRDDRFVSHMFMTGDEPPAWAVAKITNPDVWADASPRQAITAERTDPVASDTITCPVPTVKIPPRAGRGSSAKAWGDYAAAHGFEVDGDATASEIRNALIENGIPTE